MEPDLDSHQTARCLGTVNHQGNINRKYPNNYYRTKANPGGKVQEFSNVLDHDYLDTWSDGGFFRHPVHQTFLPFWQTPFKDDVIIQGL